MSGDRHPSLRGCGQARLLSALPDLGGWLFNFLFLFMISCKHMRFHKFFTFHEQCDLWSVRICVIYDTITCSIVGARSPGPARGTWGEAPPPQLPAGVGACCPAAWLRPLPFLQSLLPTTSGTTFAQEVVFSGDLSYLLRKLFSQQQTCVSCAVASPLLRSWWQVS